MYNHFVKGSEREHEHGILPGGVLQAISILRYVQRTTRKQDERRRVREWPLMERKAHDEEQRRRGYQLLDYKLRIASCDALGAAAGGDPVEEALHVGAFAPHQGEEFAGVEVRGFVAEEGFHAPLDVGGGPGAEAVTFGDDPVVAEGVQHLAEIGNGKSENGNRRPKGYGVRELALAFIGRGLPRGVCAPPAHASVGRLDDAGLKRRTRFRWRGQRRSGEASLASTKRRRAAALHMRGRPLEADGRISAGAMREP